MANEFVARNGLIAQDNSNITGSLKVTSKISIGTDYAGFPLNVAGVAYVIGGSVWVNDGYGLVNATSPNTGIYPDSTHNITIKNNNSSNVYIKSDGNVGISTTSPVYKLDVIGRGRFVGNSGLPAIQITDSSTSFGVLGISGSQAGDVNWLVMSGYPSAGDFTIRQSDVLNAVTIKKTTGNVGIGTTSPIAKLDVRGNSFFSGSVTITNSTGLLIYDSTGTYGPGRIFTSYGYLIGEIYVQASGSVAPTVFSPNSGVAIGGQSAAPPTRGLFVSGSVGIGTTSPGQKLSVVGSGNTYVQVNNGTNNVYFGKISGAGVIQSDDDIIFSPSSTELVRLSNGNIGIGTTAPVNKIQANYSPVAIDSLTATAGTGSTNWNRNAGILITGASISNGLAIGVSGTANDRKTWIQAGHPDTAAQSLGSISLNPLGGNVGIGTSAPTGALDIYGNISIGIRGATTVSSTYNSTTRNQIIYTNNSSFEFYEGVNERVRIATGGSVGIGTTTPTSKLHVSGGNIEVSNNYGLYTRTVAATQYPLIVMTNNEISVGSWEGNHGANLYLKGGNGAVIADFSQGNSSYFSIRGVSGTTPTEYFRLVSTGNVGISTTAPSTKFEINTPTYTTFTGTSNVARFNALAGTGAATALLLTNYVGDLSTDTTVDLDFAAVDGNSLLGSIPHVRIGYTGLYNPGINIDPGSEARGYFRIATRTEGSGGILTDKIVVDYLGNSLFLSGSVGIGTTSPGAKLDVVGNVRAQSFTGSFSGSAAAPGSNTNIIYNNSGVLAGSNDFVYDGTDVGIGTTAPAVYINGGFGKGIQISNNGRAGIRFHDTSGVVQNFDIGVHSGFAYISAIYSQTPSIRYQAASNHIFENNDTASVYITNTNRVGIGTTSPAERLHVDAGSGIGVRVVSSTFSGIEYHNVNGTWKVYVGTETGGGGARYNSADSQHTFYNNSSQVVRINSSGNLLVGNSNNYTRLSISNGTSTRTGLTLSDGNTASLMMFAGSSSLASISFDTFGLRFVGGSTAGTDNGTEFMRITTAGSIGVGTTAPNEKFHVAGNIHAYAPGGINAGLFASTSAGSTTISIRSSGVTHFNGGNVGIGTTNPTSIIHVLGGGGNGTAQFSGTTYTTHINYGTNEDTYIRPGKLAGNVLIADVGSSVGIGTSTPISKLDVRGGLANFGQTAASGSAFRWGSFGTAVSPDTMLCMNQLWNGSGWTILNSSYGTTALNLGTPEASPSISFLTGVANTAASIKMIILNGGNVGIGTTAPEGKLHVFASAVRNMFGVSTIALPTSGDEEGVAVIKTNSALWQQSIVGYAADSKGLRVYNTGGSTYTSFEVVQGGGSRLIVAGSGNVGIGTTAPAAKLDVVGTSGWTGVYASSGARFVAIASDSAAQNDINWDSSSDLRFSTATNKAVSGYSEKMRITSGGNVGIGTTSITQKLVVGSSDSDAILINVGGKLYFRDTSTQIYEGSGLNLIAGSSRPIIFSADGSERMRVALGGNVGIGTSIPSARLQVSGSSNTVNVKGSGSALFSVDGTVGRLFQVDDSLSGSLFSVNTAAGLPVIEAFSDNTVRIGQFGQRALFVSQSRVGIGLENPTANLHISGTTGGVFEVDGRLGVNALYISSSGAVGIGTTNPGAYSFYVNGGQFGTLLKGGDMGVGSDIVRMLKSNDSIAMIVRGDGNVGIGSTAPGATLDVVGNVRAQSFTGSFSGSAAAPGSNTNVVYNNSGVLAGSNSFVFNGTNVGIGSASPAYKLDVNGEINSVSGFRYNGVPVIYNSPTDVYANIRVLASNSTFNDGMYINYNSSGSTSAHLRFFANATNERMRIDAASGNVGIGTTSPGSKLTVIGDIATSTRVAADTINGYTGGSTPLTIQTGGAQNIIFGTNAAERMRLDTNGNLGVGVSVPIAKLHAGINLSDYSTQTFTNTGAIITSIGVDHTASRTNVLSLMRDGTSGIVYAGLAAFDMSRWSTDSTNTRTQLDIRLSNTDTATLTDVLSLRSNGTVGINTTSPTASLDVLGTGNYSVSAGGASTTATALTLTNTNDNASNGVRIAWKQATATYETAYISSVREGANSYSSLIFATSPVSWNSAAPIERMRITSTGNIGIGTTTPTVRLEVSGGSDLSTAAFVHSGLNGGLNVINNSTLAANRDSQLRLVNGTTYFGANDRTYQIVNAGTSATAADLFIQYWNGSSYAERMRITSGGNVGIGSASPAFPLDVNGTARVTALIETSTREKKDNIQSYSTDINKFKQLEPVSFTWKDTGKSDVGLIAEEVDELFPEFVSKTDEGEVTGINYGKLTTILINIVKQQQERIEKLEQQINK